MLKGKEWRERERENKKGNKKRGYALVLMHPHCGQQLADIQSVPLPHVRIQCKNRIVFMLDIYWEHVDEDGEEAEGEEEEGEEEEEEERVKGKKEG